MKTVGAAWVSRADALPQARGAYALFIEIKKSPVLPPKFSHHRLKPGTYLYAGSARGPGGIKARCARHLAETKTRRWHVDWLTSQATRLKVLALPDMTECALIHILSVRGENVFPLPRFGSSDCRTCPAHLMKTTLTCQQLHAILHAA